MTEFLPEGDASPIAAAAPMTQAPDALSSPPPVGAPYAAQPMPWTAQPVRKRKGPPWWVWVIIGVVVLGVVAVAAAGALFLGQQNKAFSPNYSGAPVEASDAADLTVVSDTATVAYDIPPEWVEGADYFDTSSFSAGLEDGQSVVGIHFTSDPSLATPQLVVVFEGAPATTTLVTLDQALDQYLAGMKLSGVAFDEPVIGEYSTPNGLEGYVADFKPTMSDTATEASVVVLGQGRRMVFVQWVSYDGPVDTAARDAFLAGLRIDD